MQVQRTSVSKWPFSPDFFTKGTSYPISASEADRMHRETMLSQSAAAQALESSTLPTLTDSYQLWAIILAVFPIITVFGNVLVVLSVFRETNLHTATNYFIVSLAGADIGLALFVMPLSGWVEANYGNWRYGTIFCDIFIMFDVMLCTASILNLAAISMDRYVAVTNPIVYSRHDNNFRVGLTIALAWILSFVIALPIACGLNNVPHRQNNLCVLYNPEYIITSSIGSFYIPCVIMIILYYRVFHAIRGRTKSFTPSNNLCAENPTHLGHPVKTCVGITSGIRVVGSDNGATQLKTNSHHDIPCTPSSSLDRSLLDYHQTNTEVGSRERTKSNLVDSKYLSGESLMLDKAACIYVNPHPTATLVTTHTNGNSCSGSRVDPFKMELPDCDTEFRDMEHFRKHLRDRIRRAKRCSLSVLPVQYSTVSGQQVYALSKPTRKSMRSFRTGLALGSKLSASHSSIVKRGFIFGRSDSSDPKRRANSCEWRASQRRTFFSNTNNNHNSTQGLSKDRMTAKRERKATKTLAIVLGVFLVCWMPFFTINVIHAFCFKYETLGEMSFCHLPKILDSIAVWLGYINSFLNPIIYTIFNVEFRKAFKKLLHLA